MSKRKRLIVIIASLLALLLFTMIIFRGWIRSSLIPITVEALYLGSTKTAATRDFPPVNQRLKNYGFNEIGSPTSKESGCSGGQYEGLSLSVSCGTHYIGQEIQPSTAYIKYWQEHSKDLENYLISTGWQKQWNALQPINEILDPHEDHLSIGVNYLKTHGKVACELSMMYNPPDGSVNSEYQNILRVTEGCNRYIDFFGGY